MMLDRILGAWKRDRERGAVTVEFVLAVPMLISVMVFPAVFGKALFVENSLEQGLREATRYLSRAPLDSSDNFYASDITAATAHITSRVPGTNSDKTVVIGTLTEISPSNSAEELRTPFRVLQVTATVRVDLPFWPGMNLFDKSIPDEITLTARDQARYHGD